MSQQNLSTILSLEHIIFNSVKEGIDSSIHKIISLFDKTNPYSFSLNICRIAFSFYCSTGYDKNQLLLFLKELRKHINEKGIDIIEIFLYVICHFFSKNGANYLLWSMYEENLISSDIIKSKNSIYFAQYRIEKTANSIKNKTPMMDEFFDYENKSLFWKNLVENINDLSQNDWELHQKLMHEGINPNELAKIIRNDEIEKLQEISSQANFDFNQRIIPSLYEKCSFVNYNHVTLIDYAAFFGSIKCFKFLMLNGAKLESTGKYAIAGGNTEIIHLCEQNHSLKYSSYEAAIEFHRNDIFKYLYNNKIIEVPDLTDLGMKCVFFDNYEILSFLLDEGININESMFNTAASNGNLYLSKYFMEKTEIPSNIIAYSTSSGNIELVKYFLDQKGININAKDKNGRKAIHIASEYGYTNIFKLLLEQKGIDINSKDNIQNTPLICASFFGNIEIVKILLEQEGIDINVKDEMGWTPLMSSCAKNHTEAAKLLLEQEGIDINARDMAYFNNLIFYIKIWNLFIKFQTALLFATERENVEIIKALLKHDDINLNAINEYISYCVLIFTILGFKYIIHVYLLY